MTEFVDEFTDAYTLWQNRQRIQNRYINSKSKSNSAPNRENPVSNEEISSVEAMYERARYQKMYPDGEVNTEERHNQQFVAALRSYSASNQHERISIRAVFFRRNADLERAPGMNAFMDQLSSLLWIGAKISVDHSRSHVECSIESIEPVVV